MFEPKLCSEHIDRITGCLEPYDNVYFYTADPGATSALMPFFRRAKELSKFRNWYVDGWACSVSLEQQQPISKHILSSSACGKTAVFMGQQVDFSRAFDRLQAFKNAGFHTHFVSDHWKDISLSFKPKEKGDFLFPDRFYVPDTEAFERQLQWLQQRGIPDEVVKSSMVAFFHPGVEASLSIISEFSAVQCQKLRDRYSVATKCLVTMMLDCTTPEEEVNYGFGWRSSLISAIQHFTECYEDTTLLVKPHPRQRRVEVLDVVMKASNPKIMVVEENAPEQFVAASDEIWGATTVLLVVARKAGKRIKVFMPNRTSKGELESNIHIEPYIVDI
jgi:hypothetical protein